MSEIINLNKARKAKDKDERKAKAAENRAKFGRAKAAVSLDKAGAEKLQRALDDAKREP